VATGTTSTSSRSSVHLGGMANMFRVPELRGKLLLTLGIILAYRFGSYIPAPGIDLNAVGVLKSNAEESGSILSLLQLFSGGALTNFAIFALGIMPYITSSIILQIR
jgi:preprotein translocase subunit SecY